MRYLPLFLDLHGAPVLVVGGGLIAARKLTLLRAADAHITIVAPELIEEISAQLLTTSIRHVAGAFSDEHVLGQRLVIAATGDQAVNARVAAAARQAGVWVNVVDDAALSSCIVPAIVDRSPLLIAISSGGSAPMLARWIRARIEALLDHSVGSLAQLLERWRRRIVERIATPDARRRFYDGLLEGAVADQVRAGRIEQASALLAQALARENDQPQRGHVALVGAGPGDPGLLTLSALRALQRADVILYDRLVSPEVLALARRDATLICVGKEAGGNSTAQDEIHRLLLVHARTGKFVARLKGGDAFLFARGGEELQVLRSAGIAFEVVPGITAAVAAGAYAGIPLTHRERAQGVRFLTAHASQEGNGPDWRAWARTTDTLAIYMGLAQCAAVSHELTRHGRAGATPVALIENASRPQQRVILGRLDELPQLALAHGLKSPTLLIVGEVASLARELHWFGMAPLASSNLAAAPHMDLELVT